MSVPLTSPNGRVIRGGHAWLLIAISLVQVHHIVKISNEMEIKTIYCCWMTLISK